LEFSLQAAQLDPGGARWLSWWHARTVLNARLRRLKPELQRPERPKESSPGDRKKAYPLPWTGKENRSISNRSFIECNSGRSANVRIAARTWLNILARPCWSLAVPISPI